MEPLPIDELRPALEAAWGRSRNFLLRAPTGSGKSTRVPRFLMEWKGFPPDQRILILQPRRVAARLLAHRVASELGQAPGETAGFQVRFEGAHSTATRLLYVTEGLLVARFRRHGALEGVGAILFDEFHERHLEGDLGLALAVGAQRAGWEGRIGVFSATLETSGLRGYLPDAEVLESEGRQYPVKVLYQGTHLRDPLWERATRGVAKALQEGAEGDILIFMPGKYEIIKTLEALKGVREVRGWDCLPLHGDLDPRDQDAAVRPGDRPRVIVATNIAETSLTLAGVRTVIDTGYARRPEFDPRRGVNTLLTEKISISSADQRAGRAGRLAPGTCLRLWREQEHPFLEAQTPPEIQRLDLAESRLQLLAMGKADAFPWLEPPPEAAWHRAGELLESLGATENGRITGIGRTMAALPLHPRFSRILVEAQARGVRSFIALALAFLEGRRVILPIGDKRKERERERWWEEADNVSDLLKPVLAWEQARRAGFSMAFCREWGLHRQGLQRAMQVAKQLLSLLGEAESDEGPLEAEALGKCLLTGYVDQLACRLDRGSLRCAVIHGRRGELRRESLVRESRLLVAADIEEREFKGEARLFLGEVTAVREAWLEELYPEGMGHEVREVMDPERRRVERVERRLFHDLVLEEKQGGAVDAAAAGPVLAAHIMREGWVLKGWDAACETFIRRLNVLAAACPEWDLSPISEADRELILEQLCEGAVAYKEVKDRPVMPILESWLPDAIQPLMEAWVPLRFAFPDGRSQKLRYEADGTVVLPAKIQQLYDVSGESLFICQGRKRLRLEILAPNQRPVHITDDLDGFWSGQYPQIKKDLFGRYPKHEWR